MGLGLAAVALSALNGRRGELVGASAALAHLRVGWLLAAIAAELASFASFGALQRKLLACGGVDVGLPFAAGLSMASGAIASSLPGGPAFSSVYAYRQYRRKGADEAVAGWVLLATLVCAALGLAIVATGGVLFATRQGASYDLIGVVVGVLVVAGLADAVVWQRRWLAQLGIACLRASRRMVARPRRQAVEVVEELFTRLSEVRLGWWDALVGLAAGVGDWAFDCAALACSFLAVGAPVPWQGLLLAYGAGMLAANLPVTPGGLGVVEGSLTVAIVAFGGAEPSTVAAVLCYRIVSFWGYLPVGWAAWGAIALVERREGRYRRGGPPDVAGPALQPIADTPGGPPGGPRADQTRPAVEGAVVARLAGPARSGGAETADETEGGSRVVGR